MMKQFARTLTATLLTGVLAVGTLSPAYAQDAPAPQAPAGEPKPANSPAPTISLESSKYSYQKAPSGFPNLIAPYKPISVPTPAITNTPKIEQMIHDGKLELTLQDAVELGLANNMDIAVARYNPVVCRYGYSEIRSRRIRVRHCRGLYPQLSSEHSLPESGPHGHFNDFV